MDSTFSDSNDKFLNIIMDFYECIKEFVEFNLLHHEDQQNAFESFKQKLSDICLMVEKLNQEHKNFKKKNKIQEKIKRDFEVLTTLKKEIKELRKQVFEIQITVLKPCDKNKLKLSGTCNKNFDSLLLFFNT